jgi:arsenate reductase
MAEAVLRSLAAGRFNAYSAGSHPKGDVHPLALALLQENRLPTRDLRSKPWDEFAIPGAPKLDFVVTVCDNAASETCPVWPGQPVTAHWDIPDPAAAGGTLEQRREAFSMAFRMLEQRIRPFASLPDERLEGASLAQELARITGEAA